MAGAEKGLWACNCQLSPIISFITSIVQSCPVPIDYLRLIEREIDTFGGDENVLRLNVTMNDTPRV